MPLPALPALPPEDPRVAELRAGVERACSMQWMATLKGVVPPGLAAPLDTAAPRIRVLRDHPRWRYMLQPTRMASFWLREHAFLTLLAALALHSSYLREAPEPVTLADLARLSGLSVTFVHEVLEKAAATGDIIKQRAPRDARYLVIELAPTLTKELDERHRSYFAMIADFTSRPDPAPAAPDAAWRPLRRLLMRATLTSAGPLERAATVFERRTFLYLMHDLLVDGPQPRRGFTLGAARSLRVTPATIRNTLERARTEGWIAPDDPLRPTAMARQRFGYCFAALETRWQALLDVAEAVTGEPGLIPWLDAALD